MWIGSEQPAVLILNASGSYLDQGFSKAAIAERIGVSRRTMHYWIDSGLLERHLGAASVHYPA